MRRRGNLVIKHHHPARLRWIVLGALMAGLLLFLLGRFTATPSDVRSAAEIARLQEENERLSRQLNDVREQKVILERGHQVESEAHRESETLIAGLQSEISSLKEELAFYRGLASPKTGSAGPRIQSFSLSSKARGRYRYELVLTQVTKSDTVTRGVAELEIEGKQNGKAARVDGGADKNQLVFNFKYFQKLEGELSLPDGFEPRRVVVTLKGQGGTLVGATRVFGWQTEES